MHADFDPRPASARQRPRAWDPGPRAGSRRTLARAALRRGGLVTGLFACALAAACGRIVREPDYVGAQDRVTDATLIGPFDGVIVDAASGEPLRDAVVVGVWSFDRGDGLVGSAGSHVERISTDSAGRYRIPSLPQTIQGPSVRLVAFHLVVYKRGYRAYRSDRTMDGARRHDFVGRLNRVALERWREGDSHAEHLLFLGAPPDVLMAARWEHDLANLDMYRAQGGTLGIELPTEPGTRDQPAIRMLDARPLLTPEIVGQRTGNPMALAVEDLTDLPQTTFYHGFALRSVDGDERSDVTVRVWLHAPDGLDPIRASIESTLPGVEPSADIVDPTWLFANDRVRVVAFIDNAQDLAVLLTCGVDLCVDESAAIVLARWVRSHIDLVDPRAMPGVESAPPSAGPSAPPEGERAGDDDGDPDAGDEDAEAAPAAPTIPRKSRPTGTPGLPGGGPVPGGGR